MKRTKSTTDAALEIVSRACAASDRKALVHELFEVVQDVVGFDCGSVVSHQGAPFITLNKPEICHTLWLQHGARYVRDMIPGDRALESQADVVHDRSVLSARERDRRSMYREYLRPLGSCNFIVVRVRSGTRLQQVITFTRVGRSIFREADVATLIRLRAPLSVALRLHSDSPMLPSGQMCPDSPVATTARRCTDFSLCQLSAREQDIVRYVARGLQNAEIAELCGTSPNTVRNQLAKIFRKLEVTTRAELVAHTLPELLDR